MSTRLRRRPRLLVDGVADVVVDEVLPVGEAEGAGEVGLLPRSRLGAVLLRQQRGDDQRPVGARCPRAKERRKLSKKILRRQRYVVPVTLSLSPKIGADARLV